MSASLSVNSYNKDDSYIISEIQSTGLYEVLLDKMEPGSTANQITFWDTIYCFQELSQNVWSSLAFNDIYLSRSTIAFFDFIPCRMSGDNISRKDGEAIGLMFSPSPILKITETILDNQKWLLKSFPAYTQERIIATDEINQLYKLKGLLKEAVKTESIIGMVSG